MEHSIRASGRAFLVGAAAFALLASLTTACGSSASSGTAAGSTAGTASTQTTTPAKTTYPLTIDNCGQKITFQKAPSRVLILNGTSVGEVETFVMLGLDETILANAQHYGVSDDPEMVAKIDALPTGGLTMNKNFDVPAEQVLAAKPDLVVSTWAGGFDAKNGMATREQLAAAGITSLVNPTNCAQGDPSATHTEKKALATQGIDSSFDFMTLLGRIFDVQQRAADQVTELRSRIDAVQRTNPGTPPKKVLIAYPGMSMMNANGLPAIMTGGIYDKVIAAAGGVNSFAGKDSDTTRTLNAEQLAAADVDVLVVGEFTPNEKPDAEAAKLFAAYPQWNASKTKTYAVVSDGVYLGPMNAWAVEKISKVIRGRG